MATQHPDDARAELIFLSNVLCLQQITKAEDALATCLGNCTRAAREIVASGPPVILLIAPQDPSPPALSLPLERPAVPSNATFAISILVVLAVLGIVCNWFLL